MGKRQGGNVVMEELRALKTDVRTIVDDAESQPVHIIINEEYINKKCAIALLNNPEYVSLSDKSIKLFNLLKCCLGDNTDCLLEYEETIARMQGIIEVEAYNLGKYE